MDVVIANIKNEMQLALSILLSGRRKLKADDEPKPTLRLRSGHRDLEKRMRGNAKTKTKATGNNPANPCDKANPNASFGLETAGKNCDGGKEVEIPDPNDSESWSCVVDEARLICLFTNSNCLSFFTHMNASNLCYDVSTQLQMTFSTPQLQKKPLNSSLAFWRKQSRTTHLLRLCSVEKVQKCLKVTLLEKLC